METAVVICFFLIMIYIEAKNLVNKDDRVRPKVMQSFLSLCEIEFPVIKVYASDLLGLFSVIEFLAPHKKVRHC